MTARQLIKALEAMDKKFPRRHVFVDMNSRRKDMDSDWSHRTVEDVDFEIVSKLDGDGFTETNADGTERQMGVIALKIQ